MTGPESAWDSPGRLQEGPKLAVSGAIAPTPPPDPWVALRGAERGRDLLSSFFTLTGVKEYMNGRGKTNRGC